MKADIKSERFEIGSSEKPRFFPLRYRLIFTTSCMLIFILGILMLVLGYVQGRTIRKQLEKRGLSIAQSLSAASMADLLTYNYIALERSANQAARDPDVNRVIFHDKEGRVAGFSGRSDLQNKFLNDEISRTALSSVKPIIQEITLETDQIPALDIAVPLFPNGVEGRWGTIRVCLSLVPMLKQINQMRWVILAIGLFAIAVGILLSLWTARRITRPLGTLVQNTQEAVGGNLIRTIQIQTRDEVEVLASNFSSMIQEILEHRKQLERQLDEIKRMQRYTHQLLTTMNDGLLSMDMKGRVSTINPAAQKLFKNLDHPVGKGSSVARSLKNFRELDSYIHDILTKPYKIKPREIALHTKNEERVLLIGSSILNDRRGHPQEVILNLHDITELKKLEISVRQAERLAELGTLAAGMAHEIRNPLSTIKTFVQLLPRKMEKPGFLEKFQRTVPRELKQINRLVEDLLELARIPKYHFEKTDIKTLLEQTIDFLEEEMQRQQIDCRCEYSSDLPPIQADMSQLEKAFSNLIRNAMQAMPSGGKIFIKAIYQKEVPEDNFKLTSGNGWITLTFQDSGVGVSPEDMKNIFNPFFTTKEVGTGLGLAITHKVITEHGGKIEAESGEGEGTLFRIVLPV
ncbi:MAG: ATP-binding protein [Thermodesulfobacteriota bacterium]|nr:ATP-binding protein [Thermodesulfobacteriota bacterium]